MPISESYSPRSVSNLMFAASDESAYFQSELFGKVLTYVQDHPSQSRLQDFKSKLGVVFEGVEDVEQAMELCRAILQGSAAGESCPD